MANLNRWIALCWLTTCFLSCAAQDPTIVLPQGEIRGVSALALYSFFLLAFFLSIKAFAQCLARGVSFVLPTWFGGNNFASAFRSSETRRRLCCCSVFQFSNQMGGRGSCPTRIMSAGAAARSLSNHRIHSIGKAFTTRGGPLFFTKVGFESFFLHHSPRAARYLFRPKRERGGGKRATARN